MSEKKTPGLIKRLFLRFVTLTLTVVTSLGAGLAVIYGAQVIQDRSDAAAPTEVVALIPVQATPLAQQDGYSLKRQFAGQVEAAQTADLAFEFGGRVAEILVHEGDSVTAGTTIARLDTILLQTELTRLNASQDALQAQLDFAELTVECRAALNEYGFTSTEAFDQAQFYVAELTVRISETNAGTENVRVQIGKSTVIAPFDGQIGADDRYRRDCWRRRAGGDPVGTAKSTGTGWASCRDSTGRNSRILSRREWRDSFRITGCSASPYLPPTRTHTASFELHGTAPLPFGQTAIIVFEQNVIAPGYWIPLGSFREGVQGLWTVLMVDQSDTVCSVAVELLHVEAQRAFVWGTFNEGALLIAQGPHRVTPGQKIRQIGDKRWKRSHSANLVWLL